MYQWDQKNNMEFNGTKFQLLRYGENKDIKNETDYFTDEMQEIIEKFDKLKDLGVIMNDKANFEDHINHVKQKVRQKI